MQARIVDTRAGLRWLVEGWRLFRAAPFGWLLVVFLYLLLTQLLAALPVVRYAVLLLVPALTVGLMVGARAVSRGASLEAGLLFAGFRHDMRPQLVLGAVYLACALFMEAAIRLADDEGVLRAVLAGTRKADEVSAGELFAPLAVGALIYAPLTMMFWFAPPLAAWNDTGAVKALFFSLVACFMNWRAFLAYAGVLALAAIALPLVALGVLALVGGRPSPGTVMTLAVVFLFVLLPSVFASFYASYRDVFGPAADGGEKAPAA
jgi:hypothetical protein